MAYEIRHVAGIDARQCRALVAAGVGTTGELVHACGTRTRRRALAERTGIEEGTLLRWARLADLMRISGVGFQYAELLDAAGIAAVELLRSQDPDALAARLFEINSRLRLARTCPGPIGLERWIRQARGLATIIEIDH